MSKGVGDTAHRNTPTYSPCAANGVMGTEVASPVRGRSCRRTVGDNLQGQNKYAPTQHRSATWNATAEARRLESLRATLGIVVGGAAGTTRRRCGGECGQWPQHVERTPPAKRTREIVSIPDIWELCEFLPQELGKDVEAFTRLPVEPVPTQIPIGSNGGELVADKVPIATRNRQTVTSAKLRHAF